MPAPVRIILGAVVALAITVLAWLPPILHFFTGPIGPGIGGFVAGTQLKLSDRDAAVMGVLVALGAGVPMFIVMDTLIGNETFAAVAAIGISIWSGGLATVAAWFAGSDEEAEVEETA